MPIQTNDNFPPKKTHNVWKHCHINTLAVALFQIVSLTAPNSGFLSPRLDSITFPITHLACSLHCLLHDLCSQMTVCPGPMRVLCPSTSIQSLASGKENLLDTHVFFWLVTGFVFLFLLLVFLLLLFFLCKCLFQGLGHQVARDAPGSAQIACCRDQCVNRFDTLFVFGKLGKASLSIISYKLQISDIH